MAAVGSHERLEAHGVRVHFEGVKAIDGVDLVVSRGELFGLIGPNGAGKTTLVNVLSGFQRPTAGTTLLSGDDVTGQAPHKLASRGLVRTFQAVRLFSRLTVFENVEVGALGTGARRAEARRLAWSLLERLSLTDKAGERAMSLTHGQQRRLGIARALATRPRFLLLDEPAAGLNEAESDELLRSLAEFRDEFELGLLVIEHDMRLIMRLCERIQVIDHGKTIAVGSPAKVRADPGVITAYLGAGMEKRHAQG
jgi:ABC-type branched-subunit amino acid transport system ATPase component